MIEETMKRAQVDGGRQIIADKKSVLRFIIHQKFTNPILRTEKLMELKLAPQVTKRTKNDLRGLWDSLAPGGIVLRTSATTTVNKVPEVPLVQVMNNEIAKFGTKAELNTPLWQNVQRRPPLYKKTTN